MSHHHPRKRFGQHFLHDQFILQQIVSAIHLNKNDSVLEIGPGQGVLTQLLLPLCARLDAVEIDRDLCDFLRKKFANQAQFFLHEDDALDFSLSQIFTNKKIRVAGNLPYNISTPLLFKLFSQLELIEDMHFLLQKEVVDRLCANVGSADYGRLSVMTQYYCQTESLFYVSPEAFTPPPRVDSAVIRLLPYTTKPHAAKNVEHLSLIVKEAFSYRRKTLSNALKNVIPKEKLHSLEIDLNKRPQDLTVAEYVYISNNC